MDVELGSHFVETDDAASENPHFDDISIQRDVDRRGTAPSGLRTNVSEFFELLDNAVHGSG